MLSIRAGVAAALALVRAGCGGGDEEQTAPDLAQRTRAAEPTATATVTETVRGPRVVVRKTVTAKPKPPPPAPSPPGRVPGDGTFQVGRDIAPGIYRNDGRVMAGAPCVAFASRKPNDLQSYLRGSTSQGPAIVTVNPGEFFTTNNCQPFRKDG